MGQVNFPTIFSKIMGTKNGQNEACWLRNDYHFNKYAQLLEKAENVDVVKFKQLETIEDIERVVNSLKRSELYAPRPEQFNDIFDTQVQLEDKLISELAISHPEKSIKNEIIKFNNMYRILSLSMVNPAQGKSSHMWGLYANSGKGIAIKYNLKELLQKLYINHNSDYFNVTAFEANDFDSLYKLLKREVSLACIQYSKDYNPLKRFKSFIKDEIAEDYIEYPTYKHKQWKNEEELRVILNLYGLITDELIEKTRHSKNPPFLRECFIPMPEPKEILIGWNITEESGNIISGLPLKSTIIRRLTGKMIYRKNGFVEYETKILKLAN